jgi:hypothetical protein
MEIPESREAMKQAPQNFFWQLRHFRFLLKTPVISFEQFPHDIFIGKSDLYRNFKLYIEVDIV